MRENIVTDSPPAHRIEITGHQWWWRVSYLLPGGESVASANEIRIPVGREIEFTLRAGDVIHSFWIPNLAGKVDMVPGRSNVLRLRASQAGIYRGQCAEFCGGVHALMALEVIAMNPGEYDLWLARARLPAAEPATDDALRGRALFIAGGCGSCHAIRGTEARGSIGPDLTKLGERRRIAAATLENTHTNLARFIADGQQVKPGNSMPPFRIFSSAELDALAAYLIGLR
jgi:cytochrome c oxidase subunit 2